MKSVLSPRELLPEACMGEETKVYRVWESQKERDHLKDQGVDGRMGSEWTLGRLAVAGSCEYCK
jgi:hypothetical protein